MERNKREVDEQLNLCADLADSGSNPYHGMTYAEGVEAAIRWLTGDSEDPPIDPNDVEE